MILKFSPEIAKKEFETIITDSVVKQKLIQEREIEPGTVPFPVLGIPDISPNHGSGSKWVTTISLKYHKRFETGIKEQIADIRPEILLFLNNIKYIETIQDGVITILDSTEKTINDKKTKTINSQEWEIEDSGDLTLPDSNKLYRFKIAYTKDLTEEIS